MYVGYPTNLRVYIISTRVGANQARNSLHITSGFRIFSTFYFSHGNNILHRIRGYVYGMLLYRILYA